MRPNLCCVVDGSQLCPEFHSVDEHNWLGVRGGLGRSAIDDMCKYVHHRLSITLNRTLYYQPGPKHALGQNIKSRETKISWASEAHHPEDPLVKVLHLLHSKLILYCASGDKGPGRPRKRMPLGLFPLVDEARLCSWRAVISPPCLGVKYYQSLSNLKSKDRVVIELLI